MEQIMAPFLLVMVRVSGMIMSMPILGAQYVSAWIKIGLVLTITIALYQGVSVPDTLTLFSLEGMLIVMLQWLIGMMLGFVFQIIAQIFVIAAQMLAMEMGLGFAAMVDPQNGHNIPLLSQAYLLLFLLLFLSVNGHLYLLEVLQFSFERFPIHMDFSQLFAFEQLIALGSLLFANSLKIALPGLLCLLVINLALGLMSKAAPQLNLFSVGFPATLIFGMLVIAMTILYLLPFFENFMLDGVQVFESMGIEVQHG